MRVFRWSAAAFLLVALAGFAFFALERRAPALPAGVVGTMVFVSDRSGMDALYLRCLPDAELRRLTYLLEPAGEPALSPDGSQVAFSMGGRIGVVNVATLEVRFLTFGVDWLDAAPAWRSDGQALVVSARRATAGATADIHLLTPDPAGGDTHRLPLTETPGLDEEAPIFGPGDGCVVFVREDNLFRVDLAAQRPQAQMKDFRSRRLTGTFKKSRAPRLLPSGRLLCLWSEGKSYGIDVLDADGKNRETLTQGSVHYRSVAPSPDGRFLLATFSFDLRFHPADILRRQREELHLLDARGAPIGVVDRSWSAASHSADWRP